jgi:hypothetical protein
MSDRAGVALAPQPSVLAPLARRPAVDLERLLAGILLSHAALQPSEPVNLALELATYGIVADERDVRRHLRRLARRYGLHVRRAPGTGGYVLAAWEARVRPVVGFGGSLCPRDAVTGRFTRAQGPERARGA